MTTTKTYQANVSFPTDSPLRSFGQLLSKHKAKISWLDGRGAQFHLELSGDPLEAGRQLQRFENDLNKSVIARSDTSLTFTLIDTKVKL